MRSFLRPLIVGVGAVLLMGPAVAANAGDPTPALIGGRPASEAYPFMASLQGRGGGHMCGASLVRPQWVLTAAHCVDDETPQTLQLRIGSLDRESGGTLAYPDRIAVNPTTDMALLHLSAAAPQQPVPLATSATPGTPVRQIGWGCTADPGCEVPKMLQEFDTTIISDNRCTTGRDYICLDNTDGWRGGCYGDSGGPSLVGTAGNWQIVGDTSGNLSSICGQGPAVHANVPANRAWITSIIGEGGGGPAPANLALRRPATGSAPCAATEGPEKAVNGSVSGGNTDKWCSAGDRPLLQVDLGEVRAITSFVVRHAAAGGESPGWNTRDFDVEVSTDATTWTTAVRVRGNTAGVSTHPVSVSGRYARLAVLAATQTGEQVARIYEFEVYG